MMLAYVGVRESHDDEFRQPSALVAGAALGEQVEGGQEQLGGRADVSVRPAVVLRVEVGLCNGFIKLTHTFNISWITHSFMSLQRCKIIMEIASLQLV